MSPFQYKKSELYCENVSVYGIAVEVGTPFYLYSANAFRQHLLAYQKAFRPVPHLIAYSAKANANLALLRLLNHPRGEEGQSEVGVDIVSEGELYRAMEVGIDPKRIVFAGVGKKRVEIEKALCAGILLFNVESEQELVALDDVAKSFSKKAPVALRVNPHVDPKTHPYISTGLKKSKFGISKARAIDSYRRAAGLPHIDILGIHSHIGSQLMHVQPFVDALWQISTLIQSLRKDGFSICYWNIGGGLGIPYEEGEAPPLPQELARHLLPILKESGCTIILEPGRSIVGNAGILVTQVLYTKKTEAKQFVVVDAGMNDLIRPSLYGAFHRILPVRRSRRSKQRVDIVGPVCESGDFLAQDRRMPTLFPNELLAVMDAGAYSFSMASNYNARPRPPELLVDQDHFFVIRERETMKDLIRGEAIPSFLQ